MAASKFKGERIVFDLVGEGAVDKKAVAEAANEMLWGLRFNLARQEIFKAPPIPLERAVEIVELFRSMTEAEASLELLKLREEGTAREVAAAMIGLTQRTKVRKLSQDRKRENAAWIMDEVIDDFMKYRETEKTKTAAARKVSAKYRLSYKTVLRHAEKRSLI